MFEKLESILIANGITELFILKQRDDRTHETPPWAAYRVESNIYKIRSFELWKLESGAFFRIYHAPDITDSLKTTLTTLPGVKKVIKHAVDYQTDDYVQLANEISQILTSDEIIKDCKANSRYASTSKFEGLELPDVDTASEQVIGQTYTWDQIIAIWEDKSEENKLKKC